MSILELLQCSSRLVSVAHHIPGRVRLKLNASAKDLHGVDASAGQIEAAFAELQALSGIHRVQVNKLARSVTVEYDNQVIPDQTWPGLITNPVSPEATALIARLRAGTPTRNAL